MSRYLQALVTAGYAVQCRTRGFDDAMLGISVENFRFCPETLSVGVGGTVTWVNLDEEAHIVASLTGLFRSAALDTAESFCFRFLKPGTYHYVCTIYPRMIGSIVVR